MSITTTATVIHIQVTDGDGAVLLDRKVDIASMARRLAERSVAVGEYLASCENKAQAELISEEVRDEIIGAIARTIVD